MKILNLKVYFVIQVSSENPHLLKFKNSSNECKPEEILAAYFKCISMQIYRQIGIKVLLNQNSSCFKALLILLFNFFLKPKNVICKVNHEIDINEEFKLRDSFENANLRLIKIITNNHLNNTFFNLSCQLLFYLKVIRKSSKIDL